MDDLLYFHSSACDFRQREVCFYVRILKERLYPLISDIDKEVEREMDVLKDKVMDNFNPDYDDLGVLHERLYEVSADYGISLAETNGYIALLGIAGIYHLWERQVKGFLIKEISHCWEVTSLNIGNFEAIKNLFKLYSTDLESFNFYDDLNELRLVTNVVKHGGGCSLRALVNINADILHFKEDTIHDAIFSGRYTLSGVDLFPSATHIERYGNAVKDFWDSDAWLKRGERRYRIL